MAIAHLEAAGEEPWLAWVHEAQDGNADSFGELVHRFWPQQLGLARSLALDEAAAEDLLQEAFLLAWKRLTSLREPAAFPGWLRRIVLNKGLRWIEGQRPTVPIDDLDLSTPPRLPDLDLPRLLARLSPRQRAVLYLTAVEGHSDSEIAELMGMKSATVRVHRLRARRKLAAWLEEDPR